MNGRTILGICLMLIGFLTIGYGGVEYGFGLGLDFHTLRKSNSNLVSFALPYSSTACSSLPSLLFDFH